MRKIIIALLLAMALTLTACTNSGVKNDTQTEETTSDTALPETEQTEQTENVQTDSPAPSYTPSRPTCDFSSYAVPEDTRIQYEFTEEDKELHGILEELDISWSIFASLYSLPDLYVDFDKSITVNFTEFETDYDMWYLELSDKPPFRNVEELWTELNRCFTENAAEIYTSFLHFASAEKVSENDGVCTLKITDSKYMPAADDIDFYPIIFELDGRLYIKADVFGSNLRSIDYSATRVLSRTEDRLEFAFIFPIPYYEEFMLTAKETLKFEDGGWKYDRFLTYPEIENYLDFAEVWGGSYEDEVTVIGEYDSGNLGEFDYTFKSIDTSFMDGNALSRHRELYQKAYALAFTLRDGYSLPEDVEGLAKIQVTDGYSKETHEYYFSGISSDSFNRQLAEVFVTEELDRLYYKYRTFYEYDGVLWVREGDREDRPVLHTEYEWSKSEEQMIIDRTAYYAKSGEEIELYEKGWCRFGFFLTDDGWRADCFLG